MLKRLAVVALMIVCFASPVLAKDKYQRPGPVRLDRDGEKWAQKTLKKLSLEEKIGQMLMIWARAEFLNVNSPEYQKLKDAMKKYHIGGFGLTVPVQSGLLMKSGPYDAAALTNQLQRDSKLPLMFAADFERGVSMRLNGATIFPHAMAFGAAGKLEFAEEFGRITGIEARAIGVQWNWFPDADVNSNPANPIINTRAFGGDPQQVGELVAAYIKGAHAAGMLTTAKHFPGHGDTDTDSHLALARVGGDLKRLETVELPPFKAAINAGVDSVMVAHVTVPALDDAPDRVGTNSPKIVTDLLKNQLGFKGLVVTDALDMNGLMRLYTGKGGNPPAMAAVATVKAGNDMVLIPGDLDGAFNGLVQAVRSGEIPEQQINESVLKILKAKASVGLHKARLVDLEALARIVESPENEAAAQRIADAAVTAVRDSGKVLPLTAVPRGTNGYVNPYTRRVEARNRVLAVIFTDDVRNEWGRVFERQLRWRVPDVNVLYVDPRIAPFVSDPVLSMVDTAEKVVAAVYAVPSAGQALNLKNGAAPQTRLLQQILERAGERTVVVAMGSPYIAADFPAVQTYLCTFSNAQVSEISAIKALFGEMPVSGRLPVSIPGIADRGAGLDLPQKTGPQVTAGQGGTNVPKTNAAP
ncbi:MAG: glycoside hydrolase family 3 protein [Terriglobales bacterium]